MLFFDDVYDPYPSGPNQKRRSISAPSSPTGDKHAIQSLLSGMLGTDTKFDKAVKVMMGPNSFQMITNDPRTWKRGWMTKQGKNNKMFKRRWFTLTSTHLHYQNLEQSKDTSLQKVSGRIPLADVFSVKPSPVPTAKSYAIEILTKVSFLSSFSFFSFLSILLHSAPPHSVPYPPHFVYPPLRIGFIRSCR
jgi:hypothetical protein